MNKSREAMREPRRDRLGRGLDGVYVGPSDLSLSMRKTPTLDPQDPEVLAAIKDICAGTREAQQDRGRTYRWNQDGHSTFRRGIPALPRFSATRG